MSDIRENIKQVLKEYTEEELYDYKPNFSAEDLLKYIESEWDIEMLELVQTRIGNRINELKLLVDTANRVEVKGFKIK